MSNIYRDEPPTEPGWYWVKYRSGGDEDVVYRNKRGIWTINFGDGYCTDGWAATRVQFGPRVPDAKRCAEIERGSDAS